MHSRGEGLSAIVPSVSLLRFLTKSKQNTTVMVASPSVPFSMRTVLRGCRHARKGVAHNVHDQLAVKGLLHLMSTSVRTLSLESHCGPDSRPVSHEHCGPESRVDAEDAKVGSK